MLKHGSYRGNRPTPTYSSWSEARNRCNTPTNKSYLRYGGRGISMCERWNDFSKFIEDMGEKPDGYFLDRINNDGNYEPGNCRWTTIADSNRNKGNCRIIEINGVKKVLAEWAREYGVNFHTARWRLDHGVPLDQVFLRKDRRVGKTVR